MQEIREGNTMADEEKMERSQRRVRLFRWMLSRKKEIEEVFCGLVQGKSKVLLCMVVAVMVLSGMRAYADSQPRVWIEGYLDGSTSGFRMSELCVTRTSGFPADAEISYKYKYNISTWNTTKMVLSTNPADMGTLCMYRKPSNNDYGYGLQWQILPRKARSTGKRYFAFKGRKAFGSKVEIWAKDQYGNEAHYLSPGFKNADVKKDVESGVYPIYIGEKKDLTDLLRRTGVVHVSHGYLNSITDLSYVQGDQDLLSSSYDPKNGRGDYLLTANKAGIACLRFKLDTSDDFFHINKATYVQAYAVAMKKPELSSTMHTVTVTNTFAGATYSIDGRDHYCSYDDQKIVIGAGSDTPLDPATEYTVVTSVNVNGHTARTEEDISTTDTCHVTFNTGGVITSPVLDGVKVDVKYNTTLYTYTLSMSGYDFKGWYDNPSYAGYDYTTSPVTQEEVTMYAKLVPRTYTVKAKVDLDGAPFAGANITLCQRGKAKYTLQQSSTEDGMQVYTLPNVPYSGYKKVSGKTYSYDIYINGKDTGYLCFLDGDQPTGSEADIKLYCSTMYVNLTKDQAAWTGQKVVIGNGSSKYQMTDNNGRYTYLQAYDSPTPTNVHPFEIHVNDVLIRDWTDANMTEMDSTKITVTDAMKANGVDLGLYTVALTIEKNNTLWTDAEVEMLQNGTVMEKPVYQNGVYSVNVMSKYPYDLHVANVYSGEDTGIKVTNDTKNTTLKYYTADFVNGEYPYTPVYYEQVVQEGKRGGKPVAPYRDDKTFMGWFTLPEKGTQLLGQTDPLTAAVTYYAHWVTPSIVIGQYVKCNASGTMDGSTSAQYYKLSNLAIEGYPLGAKDKPMHAAKVFIDTTDQLYVLQDGTASELGQVGTGTYNGSYRYKYTLTSDNKYEFFFDGGWSVAQTQQFLNSQLLVKPSVPDGNYNVTHHCEVWVFGTTVTSS